MPMWIKCHIFLVINIFKGSYQQRLSHTDCFESYTTPINHYVCPLVVVTNTLKQFHIL